MTQAIPNPPLRAVDVDPFDGSRPANAQSECVPSVSPIASVGPDAIFAPLPPIPWLVPGLHIGPGRPALIAGYGYSGKTVALQSLALSVAANKPVWGAFFPKRGRVLHLDWEMGARLAFRRYQRLGAAMGVGPAELGDRLRVATYPEVRLDSDGAEDIFARACEGFDLVVCDSFTAGTARVDENSSEAGRPLYMLGRISDRTGATFAVVHHARKPQKDAPGGARMAIRGSGAIYGASDSVFIFAAERGEPVRVIHDRSPQDGDEIPDFGLRIEDVNVGGNDRGGLRVVHMDPVQLGTINTTSAKHEATMAKVSGYLAEHPDAPGADAIQKRIGGRAAEVRDAVKEMLASGTVANLGTKARPKLRLQPNGGST